MPVTPTSSPGLSNWLSRAKWAERVLTFDPSWYLVCMGTGIIIQLLASNFPYPAQWLHTLGYIFWVLDMCLFSFFTAMSAARAVMYPKAVLNMLNDLQQTCYLGAVPIAWETIGTGLVVFYSDRKPAAYVAEVFFWIAVVMTLLVTCGGVYALYKRQGQHSLNEVTGAWFLLFIPMIVAAAFGSNLANALSLKNGAAVLVVSFLMVSLGIGLSFLFLGIYVWRLMNAQLPPRDAIVSTFVPVGPPSMAAYAIVNLSVALARNISLSNFSFRQSWEPDYTPATRAAVAESIMWVGVLICLFLLGVATFFLVEAIAAVLSSIPKTFNIGLWSFVFPVGVYANAFCRLGILLRNQGLKGFGVACVVATVLLWLMCALSTTYKAVWQGKLFFAPGLIGWIEHEEMKASANHEKATEDGSSDQAHSSGRPKKEGTAARRHPRSDGSYRPVASNNGRCDISAA